LPLPAAPPHPDIQRSASAEKHKTDVLFISVPPGVFKSERIPYAALPTKKRARRAATASPNSGALRKPLTPLQLPRRGPASGYKSKTYYMADSRKTDANA